MNAQVVTPIPTYDPNGNDDFVSGVLKLPVNRNAILQITSTDVIHNYSIVPMRIQQDAIPGQDIPMWFKPIKQLETHVICGQLCGEGHANMKGFMEVISDKAFRSWAAEQSATALQKSKASQGGATVAQK